jgi:hypothetical protein
MSLPLSDWSKKATFIRLEGGGRLQVNYSYNSLYIKHERAASLIGNREKEVMSFEESKSVAQPQRSDRQGQ